MDTSINIKAIESYGRNYAEKVCDGFFADKEKISGQEILELCNIKQINLLVLKNLFESWMSSSQNMKSPYFNYESPDVQEAFTKYINALSRNILIDRENFEPILNNSVREVFLLIFSPYEFYTHIINDDRRNKISMEELKTLKKYIKTNAHLLDDLINMVEKESKESMFIEEVYELFNEVCENTTEDPEDISPYIEKFSSVIPLTSDQVYLESSEENKKTEEKTTKEKHQGTNVNEQFTKEKSSLVETFSAEHDTLADFHESQPIESIKKGISINQKFLFVKELFGQNDDEFLDFISKLDECKDFDEAKGVIQSSYLDGGKWNPDDEVVSEFMEIVYKRFKH